MLPLKSIFAVLTLSLVLLTSVMLSGCSTPAGNAADGKRWYRMHNCFGCHGENGNDGKAPDISGLDMSFRQFLDRLRNTRTAIMPAYSKDKINDQDAADILAFLQGLP
jgi:mono/diheme cytochrome c family protein